MQELGRRLLQGAERMLQHMQSGVVLHLVMCFVRLRISQKALMRVRTCAGS